MSDGTTNINIKNTFEKIAYFIGFVMIFLFKRLIYQFQSNMGIVISAIIYILLAGGFIYNRYKSQLSNFNPRGFGNTPLNSKIALWMVGVLLINFIIDLFLYYKFVDINMIKTYGPNHFFQNIPHVIAVTLVAAIMEELLFRGIFFNYFFNKNDTKSTVLVLLASSLLFGFAHGRNEIIFSFIGFLYGITYLYTKDIRYPMFLHFMSHFLDSVVFNIMYYFF